MGSLRGLAARMDALATRIAEDSNQRAVNAAEAILKDLVFVATPVDTSTALSNWQVGLGAPDAQYRFPFFAGEKGSTRGQSAQAAYAEGVKKLQAKKPGETIYISNATPYIKQLDEGSSAQFRFPGGFKARAAIVGNNAAKQAVKK